MPGTYTVSIRFYTIFPDSQVTVPITLNVAAPPPVLRTNASQLQFSYMIGGPIPPAQTIQITSTGASLSANVTPDPTWLSVSALVGTTPFGTDVKVDPTSLAVGTYYGKITIATALMSPSPSIQTVNVTLTVTADNRPSVTSVVNGASFKPTISPGSWVTLLGKNLSTTSTQATSAWLSTSLNGVTAQLSGPGGSYSLLVYYISPNQINAFVPYEVSPMMFGAANVQLSVSTSTGATSYTVDCEAISPGLFVVSGYAAGILYPDNLIVGTAAGMKTVSSGSIVSLYGTGFGQTVPASSNVNGPVTVSPLLSSASVTVGGIPSKVLWVGMVSMGLYQINIVVPTMPGSGDYPVIVQIGGTNSPSVNLPVR
jgi:uncharacterized protein (TIGR03437 family)